MWICGYWWLIRKSAKTHVRWLDCQDSYDVVVHDNFWTLEQENNQAYFSQTFVFIITTSHILLGIYQPV